MEKIGVIEKTPDPDDGRTVYIELTEKGTYYCNVYVKEQFAIISNIFSEIDEEDAKTMIYVILNLYLAKTNEEAKSNWSEIYSAVLFSYRHYCWERQANDNNILVYTYIFTKDNGRLRAWHSGELVYFYGNIPDNSSLYDVSEIELSKIIVSYLVNFIKTGNPNGDKLPIWQPSRGNTKIQELGDEITVQNTPYLKLYDILDDMYGYQNVQKTHYTI